MLDYQVKVHTPLLMNRFNLIGGNAHLATEEHLPMLEEVSKMRDTVLIPGGAAMNAARAANWMLAHQRI